VKKALKKAKKKQRNNDVKAVIGLGNPGVRYRRTRHNIGFELCEELVKRYGLKFKMGKGDYIYAISEELDTVFAKPITYMNNSGIAVKDIVKRYNVNMEDLMVIYDDLDLMLGRFKIKKSGSGGTHNGMRSIIRHLSSDGFPRLKFGIDVDGRRESGSSVDFVLSNFSRSEKEEVENLIPKALNALDCYITEGLEKAMNTYN
jgi:PTH1 family peptidyl-tRNA hydrolase